MLPYRRIWRGGNSTEFPGAGTAEDPYRISSAERLARLAELVNAGNPDYNDKYYLLTNNLDLSDYDDKVNGGKGWVPIGINSNLFKGTFDGNNHKITGLFIKCTENYIGLFGSVKGGTVKNLGLEQVNITGGSEVGGVAGYVYNGSVTGCYVTGTVTGTGYLVGGVVGFATHNVTDSYATGPVSGISSVGGVAGFAVDVTGSYATGPVSGTSEVGGVVGRLNGKVTDCAALNPGISGNSAVGRVAGKVFSGTLERNVAFSGMKVKVNNTDQPIKDGAEDNLNGKGIDATTIKADGTIDGHFSVPLWVVENGRLPILSNVGGPQSGACGVYLTVRDIMGAAVAPDNATYTYTGHSVTPALTVTFDGQTLSEGEDYQVSVADDSPSDGIKVGIVKLKVTGIGNFGGTKTDVEYQITKADGPEAPASVTGSYTGNGSTFTYTIDSITGGEYKMDEGHWQADNRFTGIAPGTTHTFYARITETSTHKAGKEGDTGPVTFQQLADRSAPPINYTISEGGFPKTVTIGEVTGAEYKFNEGTYGTTRTYISNREEKVTLYIRLKETATHKASEASRITIDTATRKQSPPPAFTLSYESVNDTGYTVTIPPTEGAEYSFDGSNWSITNTKAGCQPGDRITGYKRMAEKPGYNAGAATSASVTLPPFPAKEPTASQNGGGGNQGRSRGSSSGTGTTVAPASGKQSAQPVVAAITVTAAPGTKGRADAAIPEQAIADAIAKAQADARARGKGADGIGISVTLNNPADTKTLSLILTQPVLKRLVDSKVKWLEINGQLLTLQFDRAALQELRKQSTGDVIITVQPVRVRGVRSTYAITIRTVKEGKSVNITSLGKGRALVSILYTPGRNEAAGGLYGVYVDAEGNAVRIADSVYDANRGCVIFTTGHFSVYGVGYTAPTKKYKDISTHWSKEAIDYVTGRGLLTGISETSFAPDAAMTRGMLVTALGRLAGVDTEAYKAGILQGTGSGQFAPDQAVTREEAAAIFVNYAKAAGYTLPVTREAVSYADASDIGSAYRTAVMTLQRAGVVMGEKSNRFNPKAEATRAEVSAMLYRYIKLTITPATACGWSRDDDGQWYYFYDDGTLARSTKVGGYEVDENGVRKTK